MSRTIVYEAIVTRSDTPQVAIPPAVRVATVVFEAISRKTTGTQTIPGELTETG